MNQFEINDLVIFLSHGTDHKIKELKHIQETNSWEYLLDFKYYDDEGDEEVIREEWVKESEIVDFWKVSGVLIK